MRLAHVAFATIAAVLLGGAMPENPYAEAAISLDETIEREYAYLDKLPGGSIPRSDELEAQRASVRDEASLLHYAEDRMASLADHHAITGSSFSDSRAVIPTYADLWITSESGRFVIDSVREDSPAAEAGVRPGEQIVEVDGVPIGSAVEAFWNRLGLGLTARRAAYAARVLAAGRRDRDRQLTLSDSAGENRRRLTLPSLYAGHTTDRPPITVDADESHTVIRFNNSLGDQATIAAFDEAMEALEMGPELILDLRDTPSGGNTTVARAIMGWFVTRPRGYQVHNRPGEERATGIARQWIEQVLPRRGKYRDALPTILVGRWTGSMGEGLAIGFDALGASVRGTSMAGLNGSIEDFRLGESGLVVKLPTEKLMTIAGLPREEFVPRSNR